MGKKDSPVTYRKWSREAHRQEGTRILVMRVGVRRAIENEHERAKYATLGRAMNDRPIIPGFAAR